MNFYSLFLFAKVWINYILYSYIISSSVPWTILIFINLFILSL
jgi:hypothetical protein